MKRFVLFSGEYYYPGGGWFDYAASFDTLEEAQAAHEPRDWMWAHVADLQAGAVVAQQEGRDGAWKCEDIEGFNSA